MGAATTLLGFTADQVCALTGLTKAQLSYWDETNFFRPTPIPGERYFNRFYSFRDVVGLRVIATLRDRTSLQHLRRVGEFLHQHHDAPWSSLRFYLAGKVIHFSDPRSGEIMDEHGQRAIEVALEPIASEMQSAANQLRERSADEIGKVERKSYVLHGAWCVAGTRVSTAAVWRLHDAGYSHDAIIREFPRLTQDDVSAAIEFERGRQEKRAS